MVAVLGGVGALPSAAGDPAPVARQAASVAARAAAPAAVPAPAPTESGAGVAEAEAYPAAALPADSGAGRRVVFSESRQRVWLVSRGQQVERTYLVSGSFTDNLHPGTYAVYSRSAHAYGIDDSGTMRYFVRFTQGDTGAAIGFHDIPVDDGAPVQTLAQLGTPQSHGCIRQRRSDAIALWRFAPLGTTVVVTA
jgi:hypothetical protein